jgi:hypothetical protein
MYMLSVTRCGGALCPPPPDRNLKNNAWIDTIILDTLRDSSFNRNQPMKSGDHAEKYNMELPTS